MRFGVVAAALIAVGAASAVAEEKSRLANPKDIAVADLMQDAVHQAKSDDSMGVVMWFPTEFWRISVESEGGKSDDGDLEKIEAVLGQYVLIGVADGDIGPFGGVQWAPEEMVRDSTRLIDAKGKEIAPLPTDQIDSNARNLMAMLRPVFANLVGALGENLHLLFFPNEGAGGGRLIEASQAGSFSVRLGKETFPYKLPLPSLLKPVRCPVDGERLSGAWRFCPHHGKPLEPTD